MVSFIVSNPFLIIALFTSISSAILKVLRRLRDNGNTVVVIEHNMDVIKTCDWIIDLGPEGGSNGGEIVASGTPEELSKNKKSHTGMHLVKELKG